MPSRSTAGPRLVWRPGRFRVGLERLFWVRQLRVCGGDRPGCWDSPGSGGDEESEGDHPQGYKRWYLERVSRAADQASGRYPSSRLQCSRQQGEGRGHQEAAGQESREEALPGEGEGHRQGQEREKEKEEEAPTWEEEKEEERQEAEEEEKSDPFRWEDCKLLQQLQCKFSNEKALEAPLKRKSLKEPGSVLSMLLDHVSAQLQQNAEVDTPATRHGDLTSGVKVMTYLSLIIKPQFSHRSKELRELHMLASTRDLLRQGQLAKLGDVLAERFVAIHQSLLDASWVSARHLEVLPMPEGAALGDGEELKGKRISYTGEELSSCHPLSLDQVVPGLPPAGHGGSVDVLGVVSAGTRRLLEDPSRLVIADTGQVLPPLQAKVHCPSHEILPLCKELVKRNICTWTKIEDVFHYRGPPVLSGLFGVEKPTALPDGRKVLRLIMNLIPANACMDSIHGAVRHLPSITAWLGLSLGGGEGLALFQSDLTAAFYLFRLPKQWERFLAFNVKVNGAEIDLEPSSTYVLSCAVLPMGWSSSVSIMQEIAEHVALRGGMPSETQLVRGRALPPFLTSCIELGEAKDMPWWHVYLDNFCAGQKVLAEETSSAGQALHSRLEDAWSRSGLVSSAKKRISDATQVQELGAWVDGTNQMISVSGERLLKLVQTTIWALGGRILRKKVVQIVVGRWVHVLQFPRPGMIVLEHVWDFISGKASGPRVVAGVRRELWSLILLTPFLHCNLHATIDSCATASDASTLGGAVGISHSLTQAGMDFVLASKTRSFEVDQHPILVISLFNGIGGCFRVYDVLNIQPKGMIAVEIYGPANRIVQKRWPHVQVVTDVRDINYDTVHQWLLQFPMIEEIHLWAGFPCTDLSRVRAFRQGLQGPASSLVFEIPRIEGLLRQVFGSQVLVKRSLRMSPQWTKKRVKKYPRSFTPGLINWIRWIQRPCADHASPGAASLWRVPCQGSPLHNTSIGGGCMRLRLTQLRHNGLTQPGNVPELGTGLCCLHV